MARTPLLLFAWLLALGTLAQDLVRGEYFLDVDPGFGNGTPINFPAALEVDLQLPVDVNGLSTGGHVLGIRMKDDDGHWGLTNRRHFTVRSMATGGDITAFEYFLDTDPGFGLATAVSTGGGTTITDLLFDVLTGNLSAGAHTLFVRAFSEHGAASLTNSLSFDVLVGIGELTRYGITAGPNPTTDVLELRRTGPSTLLNVDLVDALGERITTRPWTSDRLRLVTSELAPGPYFLLIHPVAGPTLVVKLVQAR